mgnify:CR=1 FL=1
MTPKKAAKKAERTTDQADAAEEREEDADQALVQAQAAFNLKSTNKNRSKVNSVQKRLEKAAMNAMATQKLADDQGTLLPLEIIRPPQPGVRYGL